MSGFEGEGQGCGDGSGGYALQLWCRTVIWRSKNSMTIAAEAGRSIFALLSSNEGRHTSLISLCCENV